MDAVESTTGKDEAVHLNRGWGLKITVFLNEIALWVRMSTVETELK